MDLILASRSPRREELLRHFGLNFQVIAPVITELEKGIPQIVVETNAERKTQTVSCLFPDALTIGADTIVVLGDAILGKPRDKSDVHTMLSMLSGRQHLVITAVTLGQAGSVVHKFVETTEVYFRSLTEDEIICYANSGEPLDKAGGYGIQGFGGLFVERIHGCYYNVVGLPMPRLALALREVGIEVFR